MRRDEEGSEFTGSGARRDATRGGPAITFRRPGGLAVFVVVAAIVLAGFAGTGSSHARGREKSGGSTTHARGSGTARSAASSTTKDVSSAPLDQWAACERAHGDPDQADPTVAHEVIYIAVQMGALRSWNPNDPAAACGGYLAAARTVVAGGPPIDGWGDDAAYVQYANCMRANGYPTFPYPSGVEPDGHLSTNFNGTGIDPNSPAFLNGNANQMCGKQIGAPAWWINNWGPPGSVDVYRAGGNPNSPLPMDPPKHAKAITATSFNGGPAATYATAPAG